MKPNQPRFTEATLGFLTHASRQKSEKWLEKNRDKYEEVLVAPLKNLAETLKLELQSAAPGYHFPQKGIGRIKRPKQRVEEGGGLYKDWIAYSASRPSESRFEHNPNLFFLMQPKDVDDPVLVAGGLYLPSSRQVRAIREAIAADATPFDRLFAAPEFHKHFKGGFSDEKISSRPPRGFDASHPRMDWIKLQAFFVWKPYTVHQLSSPNFPSIVVEDWRQVLRLNELLEKAIAGNWKKSSQVSTPSKRKVSEDEVLGRIEEIGSVRRRHDF